MNGLEGWNKYSGIKSGMLDILYNKHLSQSRKGKAI
jgi:hypothetical protein